MNELKTYAFIFARGGSKGVHRKNLRPLGGKPLLVWSIDFALAHPEIDRVIVSTDDLEIAAVARDAGAEAPFLRPAELASDTAPEHLAWQHAIREVSGGDTPCFDVFVSLPATCPLRAPEDISSALTRFRQGDAQTVLTVAPARSHPINNIVVIDDTGAVRLYDHRPEFTRRQDMPEAWDLVPLCFVCDPAFIMKSGQFFDGRVVAVPVPQERAVDIDTEMDLDFAQFLWERQQRARAAEASSSKPGPETE